MSIISIRLNPTEERIFTEYAKFHGKNLSSLLKESLIEKMEEEFDIKLLAEAKEYNKRYYKVNKCKNATAHHIVAFFFVKRVNLLVRFVFVVATLCVNFLHLTI